MAAPASSLETRPFSDSYLLAFSAEHIPYEIDMFFGMVEMLTRRSVIGATSEAEAVRLKNALIEVFAIHLRNIIDFMYLERPQPTDVVAADFCTAGAWQAVKPPITNNLEAARVRANKEIAHLTSQRIAGTPPEKAWDPCRLAAEIRPLLQLVVARAEITRLSPQVAAAIR